VVVGNKIGVLLILMFSILPCYSQDKLNIGVGVNAGYRSTFGEGGFMTSLRVKNHIDIYGGVSFGKFMGVGISGGINTYFLNTKLQPLIGLSYNNFSGNQFSIGNSEVDEGYYKVNPTQFFVFSFGCRRILKFDDSSAKGFMAFVPSVTYRYYNPEYKVIYISGVYNSSDANRINNWIGNGIGFNVSLIFYIGFRKTEKD